MSEWETSSHLARIIDRVDSNEPAHVSQAVNQGARSPTTAAPVRTLCPAEPSAGSDDGQGDRHDSQPDDRHVQRDVHGAP